ncbi:unnamed protein product, partial [Closterium sp. NIES-64]
AHHKRHLHGGSGLSLHISKQLVSLMGGSMGLLSTQGRGTTLHVALPLTAAPALAPAPAHAPSSAAAAAAAPDRAANLSTGAPTATTAGPVITSSTRRVVDGRGQVAVEGSSEGAEHIESGREVRRAGGEGGELTGHTQAIAAQGRGEVQGGEVGATWVSGTTQSAKEALKEMLQGMAIL